MDEPYREIRLYDTRGLCDCDGRPLNTAQLSALADLATSQRDSARTMHEFARFWTEPKREGQG